MDHNYLHIPVFSLHRFSVTLDPFYFTPLHRYTWTCDMTIHVSLTLI